MKRTYAASLGVLAGLLGAGEASAQVATSTTSSGYYDLYSYEYDGRRNDTYDVRVTGSAGGVTIFDNDYLFAFSDATVRASVLEATRTRGIVIDGRPAILRFGDPVLVSYEEVFLDSFTAVSTSTRTTTSVTVQTTSGDAPNNIVYAGDRGFCYGAGASGATNYAPFDGAFPECDGIDETIVGPGAINTNTHTMTVNEIIESSFTNEDYLNIEHYAFEGETVFIGAAHTATQSFLFDRGADLLRRVSRIESVANASPRFWLESYNGDADGPEGESAFQGVALGATFAPAPHWTLGVAVDGGEGDLSAGGLPERADLSLTQIIAHAGFESGAWFASAAGTYGNGDVVTQRGDDTLGGVSRAAFDASVLGASVQTGLRLGDQFFAAPQIGADWLRVTTDGFTETGGIALTAAQHEADRSRAWAGFGIGAAWGLGQGVSLELNGRGRLIWLLSGQERTLDVAFADAPGAGMQIVGRPERDQRQEAEVSALLRFGGNFAMTVALETGKAGRYQDQTGSIGLRAAW